MQNFGVTNKEHYGMLWYFWSGQLFHCYCFAKVNAWNISLSFKRAIDPLGYGGGIDAVVWSSALCF